MIHKTLLLSCMLALQALLSACAGPARPPFELTLAQRSQARFPGWDEPVQVYIGDITLGQVQVEVSLGDRVLAGPKSLLPGRVLPFSVEGAAFELRLLRLDNALIGEDYARLSVAAGNTAGAQPGLVTVETLIEQRLQYLGALEGAIFIRNGQEYPASEAVSHLRRKWSARRAEVQTLEDFIRLCATASEQSGLPYRLRLADGREIELATYLRER